LLLCSENCGKARVDSKKKSETFGSVIKKLLRSYICCGFRFAGHVGIRHGRVSRRSERGRLRPSGSASSQRPSQLQQYGVRDSSAHRHLRHR